MMEKAQAGAKDERKKLLIIVLNWRKINWDELQEWGRCEDVFAIKKWKINFRESWKSLLNSLILMSVQLN